ncbi:MAG: thioredoxin-dependent thiol peroxidase [Bacteroidia bacterium]|nr:thioredoxin-dependent thiol peroxidase [Bacteroidia bacterium]MDW8346746.1 thioredoxin-dependent thiol peroxidase [Bacteroidia bacterium]
MNLNIGDTAPDFSAKDQNGNLIHLSDYRGKTVVLYFYPKDNTPGCTKEACNFRDNYSQLLEKGIVVLGVSADDEASHRKFAEKFNLPFSLLVDTDKKIIQSYGAWGEKNMYGKKSMGVLRITFIIDPQGKIKEIIKKVDTENATEQVLKKLGS